MDCIYESAVTAAGCLYKNGLEGGSSGAGKGLKYTIVKLGKRKYNKHRRI